MATTVHVVSYQTLETALAPIGGAAGLPLLLSSVALAIPGGAGLPPELSGWLTRTLEARSPVTVSVTTEEGRWSLELVP